MYMKNLFVFIMLLLPLAANAQDIESMLLQRPVECSDISYNSAELYSRYILEGKLDSAKYVVEYWEKKCGNREPVFRAKLLLALKENNFSGTLLDSHAMRNIFNFNERMEMGKKGDHYDYDNDKSHYGFVPIGGDFDSCTSSLATELKGGYDPGTAEYAIAELYAGDDGAALFRFLRDGGFAETDLQRDYREMLNEALSTPEAHFAILTGVWIPTGDLTRLGLHPELGIQFGAKHRRMNYDLTILVRFINSPNEYYARRGGIGTPELTNKFWGGYIGLDVGYDVIRRRGHELQLMGGFGYDGFTAIYQDILAEPKLKSAAANSYNLNMGIGYRHYFSHTFYMGLSAKYNIVDYTMSGAIDFTGNPVTVRLAFGWLSDPARTSTLRKLSPDKLRGE